MLDFWYSERCTRQMKLIVSILLCIAIYYCSSIAKLSPLWVGISLATGIFVHVFKQLSLKQAIHQIGVSLCRIIIIAFPTLVLIGLYMYLPPQNKLYLSLQSLGFIALGFILIANYENRAKRVD